MDDLCVPINPQFRSYNPNPTQPRRGLAVSILTSIAAETDNSYSGPIHVGAVRKPHVKRKAEHEAQEGEV